jgi:hypothetical protein
MSTKLDQIMEKAKSNPKLRFTSFRICSRRSSSRKPGNR